MGKYRWVRHHGETLYDVGILPDGSLHNPRGYPEEDVRQAVTCADARHHKRASEAAKKAAMTRKHRQEKRVYVVAARIVGGHVYGPATNCVICGRGLGDNNSIERGIGSECWQGVLAAITHQREAA